MLDARVIPAIVGAVEFGDPKPLVILNNRLGPRAAHRRADQHEFFYLNGVVAFLLDVIAHDRVGDFLQLPQFQRLIEFAARRRGLLAQPEAQRAGPVVRQLKQIV